MTKLETFFNTCVYLTIVIFIFTLLFNVIMGMGVFSSTAIPGGTQLTGNTSEVIQAATISPDYSSGIVMDNVWSIALIGGIGGVAIAILTQSTSIIGVYLFCYVFWSAYGNLISILSVGSFLTGAMWGFVVIGTGVMVLVFIAAVIGMLSGSG